jgi:hypothetical protein
MMTKDCLVRLTPSFQKRLFEKILIKYSGSINAEKILKIPASSIRGYKNLYFCLVKQDLLIKLINLGFLTESELSKNTLETLSKKELVGLNLGNGRKKRINKLKNMRSLLPKVSEIVNNNELNFLKWFEAYHPLLDSGFRKSIFLVKDSFLYISYNNFAKAEDKKFEVQIPVKFILNKKFSYFFGLWCGDSAGGKRFGVVNQNEALLSFTEDLLKEMHQRVEKILYFSELIEEPKVTFDKKYMLKTDKKGWVLSIHSNNGILASFFNYLYENLQDFLNFLNLDSFFAGLFDAEGNVSLYNRSIRIACKDKEKVRIYTKFLEKEGFSIKYDGGCIVIYNLILFFDKFYTSIIHSKRKKLLYFLCTGKGEVPLFFQEVINYVTKHPNCTQKEIAKALKKAKVFQELKLLCDFEYLYHKGYPFRYFTQHRSPKL